MADVVRAEKDAEFRRSAGHEAAMLPYSELEYGGFRDTESVLL